MMTETLAPPFSKTLKRNSKEWLALGDHVIVGVVNRPSVEDLSTRHGLRSVFFYHHDREGAAPTCSRGNRVIDGMWATVALDVSACGYFAPGET
jgi:hypothetical protein